MTQLRRGNNTLQEEVALLEQGLAERTSVIKGLKEQVIRQRQQNTALRSRLQEVRSIVSSSFSSLPLPPNHEPCCAGNVEEYLHHLAALMREEEASELRCKVATMTPRLREDIRRTLV